MTDLTPKVQHLVVPSVAVRIEELQFGTNPVIKTTYDPWSGEERKCAFLRAGEKNMLQEPVMQAPDPTLYQQNLENIKTLVEAKRAERLSAVKRARDEWVFDDDQVFEDERNIRAMSRVVMGLGEYAGKKYYEVMKTPKGRQFLQDMANWPDDDPRFCNSQLERQTDVQTCMKIYQDEVFRKKVLAINKS
jgi:hypothetical protein